MEELSDDRYCFACGERNPIGLKLTFKWDGTTLRSTFILKKEHQGYTDIIHGGLISTIMDECLTNAAIKAYGVMVATAELTVRFRASLAPGQEAMVEATAQRPSTRLITAGGTMVRLGDGAVIATATAKLMPERPRKPHA